MALQPNNKNFATTRWSMVACAGQNSSPDSQRALADLCEAYWVPLYGYIKRRVNNDAEARDMTQAFFTELLEKKLIGDADPSRGKFRSYLLGSLKHFLSHQWEKANALKRGGGKAPISLNFASVDSSIKIEPVDGLTPEQIFDRDWAMTLLSQIMERLKSEYVDSGKAELFAHLKPLLIGSPSGKTWGQVAERLQMTEAAAKMAGSRMRKRYREILRQEIADTVSRPEDVDDEIRNLFRTLQG